MIIMSFKNTLVIVGNVNIFHKFVIWDDLSQWVVSEF